jgi:hypothetical protein
MGYLVVGRDGGWVSLADRRGRYVARSVGRKRLLRAGVPMQRAKQRVRERDEGARWERILALTGALAVQLLDDDARLLWVALQDELAAYWLEVSAEHYNLGYEAGRAQAWLEATLADQPDPRGKLRAVAEMLSLVVATLGDELTSDPPS